MFKYNPNVNFSDCLVKSGIESGPGSGLSLGPDAVAVQFQILCQSLDERDSLLVLDFSTSSL